MRADEAQRSDGPGPRATLVVPAFEPGPALEDLLSALSGGPFESIVVVDDGSGAPFQALFHRVERAPGVVLLRHEHNRGKGAALKTAFRHILDGGAAPDHRIVTADADGQHGAEDIAEMARRRGDEPRDLVLGVRDFAAGDMPWRSRFGNTLTRRVLRWTHRIDVADTQTGLRSLSAAFTREALAIEADRYEFELECLLLAGRRGYRLVQHPIRTIYIDANASSHFRPLMDSFRIYRVIIAGLRPARDS